MLLDEVPFGNRAVAFFHISAERRCVEKIRFDLTRTIKQRGTIAIAALCAMPRERTRK
jgi:hypothetical protein